MCQLLQSSVRFAHFATIYINKARTWGTLRKFKLVTSGDQLATSAQKSSAAFKSVLKTNVEAVFGGEGADLHLERNMLNIPDEITCQTNTDTNETTKANPNITERTQMKCNWNDGTMKCNRKANAKCSQRMCKSHCQQTYNIVGHDRCIVSNHRIKRGGEGG